MCGLVGVAGYIGQKEESVFKRLLEIDTIRGPHSTGVLVVDANGEAEIVKAVGTPWNLYEFKAFDDAMRGSQCVLMGHNRWATKGKISRRNAHPFEHSHITGAHNGTLRSQQLLVDHKEFEVDSDNIFHSIAKVGVDETISKTCGAFALTWYDSVSESMNFVRNDERPLWLCESEDSRTLFWASELWMITVTLELANIHYKEPYQPKPGELYNYPIELAYAPKAFKDISVRSLELHKWPVHKTSDTVFYRSKTTEVNGNTKKEITAQQLIQQGELEFFVASLKTSEYSTQKYVSCMATQDDCDIELRLYSTDSTLIELMVNSCKMFTGKVRGYSTAGGNSYCILDPRTIKESEKDVDIDQDEEEFAVIFGGEVVSEEEYEIAVSCGCGNCKTVPTIEESVDLVWLDKFNFICGDCKDLPVVKDFINKETNAVTH